MQEQLTTDQLFIRKLVEIVVANLGNENFGVNELAHESGMSRARLNRKLNAITKKSINQFIREVRLQKALEMLQNESLTVSEVAFKVGFNSPNYFNTCFHEYFGYPPGKVKKGSSENPDDNLITSFISIQEQKRSFWKALAFYKTWILVVFGLIVVVVILSYPKIFKRDTLDNLRSSDGRISVVVMPFRNQTNDTVWNIWQECIQDNLITYLSNFPEALKIRQTESIRSLIPGNAGASYASITPSVAAKIARKLDANIFIFGSIQKAGATLRLNARLINTRTENALTSFEIDGPCKQEIIFQIIDSLKRMLTNYLVISKLEIGVSPEYRDLESNSPEAYRYFIYGNNAMMKGDFLTSVNLYSQAIKIDSTFNTAIIGLIIQYINFALYEDAKKLCLKVYNRRDQMPLQYKNTANWIHALLFETPREAINYLRQSLEIDDQMPGPYYLIGMHYNSLYQFDQAIPEFEKAENLYKKWHTKPGFSNYTSLGYAYHKTGHYKKEKKIYRKAEHDYPGNSTLLFRQAILALTEGNTIAATQYIEKYESVRKDQSWSDVRITTGLAEIYYQAGIMDKAEECYRQALSLEPENSVRMDNLAYFLIDKDRNINKGMVLNGKALELSPDNYTYLHTKGWGLYKQGKYQEAIDVLQKSWNLRMKNAIYNHEAWLHLEAVKKAVANQKNN
jgi:tetratricopeptide (TPR) repeat protein/AraC-like DNA-binding protein